MGDAQQGEIEQPDQDVCLNILGTNVSVLTFLEAEEKLGIKVDEKSAFIFSSANVYSVMLGYDDPSFREMVNDADVVLPDGMPLVWASRLLGHPNAERIHGDDFMLACFGKYRAWRHFFVGGRVGQAQKVITSLRNRFPGIHIAGSHETPERPISEIENACLMKEIETANPDIIWVGMGTPLQDYWMRDNKAFIHCPMVGVGSSFDILAGYTRPAPLWIKKLGLQWLFRLLQEPRRLSRRYLFYNPRFILAIIKQLTGRQLDKE